jgi:two-component sensor histidine kinase
MTTEASRSAGPVEFRLPPEPGSVSRARHEVKSFVEALGADATDVGLAVTEAVSNAVAHGFRDGSDGTIVVRVETLVPDTLAVTVCDDGLGIAPNLRREGLGLGLAMIGRLTSDLEITAQRPHGTRVHMRFPLVRPA